MRLFTAVDVPAGIVERLAAFQRSLKPLARLSWSPASNFHITTKFLGEIDEAKVEDVKRVLAEVPARMPIPVALKRAGFFPNGRAPRVLWAGVEASPALTVLHHDTDEALAAIGVPRADRPFHPHLTLARIRESQPLGPLMEAVTAAEVDFGDFTATSQFLYLSRAGHYTKLSEHPFAS